MCVCVCVYGCVYRLVYVYINWPNEYPCSPMVREIQVQSQAKSYQRLKKMALDAMLLNTQHYYVRIKGKYRKWSSVLPYTLV